MPEKTLETHTVIFFCLRAVRGVVGHGDAPGSEDHYKSGSSASGPSVRPLRHAHSVYPSSHGRFISVPPCSPPPLVSLSRTNECTS